MSIDNEWTGKTYWIVGASSGLGEALALELSARGASLILSARNEAALFKLAADLPHKAQVIECDVSKTLSVERAFKRVIRDAPIDGVIFCAGIYKPMRAQKWDAETVENICNVNFVGAARILGVCIPHLIDQGRGHVALIGSLAGLRGIPAATAYGASKAGLIHMAENLKADLPPEKFKIQVINPGFIKTRLTDQNTFKMPFIMDVEEAATRTRKALESKRFETNYPTRFALMFKILGLLPNFLYFPIVRKFLSTKPK